VTNDPIMMKFGAVNQIVTTIRNSAIAYRDRASVAHYTGGKVNELSAVGQYKMHSFEIIAFDLETRVRGHSRSLEMTQFDPV